MEIGAEQASKLCSALEFQLFQESLHPEILTFSEERVRKRVQRATELCQLWSERVRLEQQRHNASASDSTRRRATTGYVTAELKATLFAQVLARFETRLAQQARKTRTIPKPLGPV
ncbi:MAG: hypothetical protein IPP14_10290 [Planctomycetes bacterium]|nr:hypothetical protein [Planctomycetota bacterium]